MRGFSYLTVERAAVVRRGDQWSAVQAQRLIGSGEARKPVVGMSQQIETANVAA